MKKQNPKNIDKQKPDEPVGYPLYPESEDIYSQAKEEQDIDPEDITREKDFEPDPGMPDIDFEYEEVIMGTDLDVPGSELDDEDEEIGSEDEENNYWSIGGDNHNNLEESHGDEE